MHNLIDYGMTGKMDNLTNCVSLVKGKCHTYMNDEHGTINRRDLVNILQHNQESISFSEVERPQPFTSINTNAITYTFVTTTSRNNQTKEMNATL